MRPAFALLTFRHALGHGPSTRLVEFSRDIGHVLLSPFYANYYLVNIRLIVVSNIEITLQPTSDASRCSKKA